MRTVLTEKKENYQMDQNAADAALQNILAACDKEPNTIPFEKLSQRRSKNTVLYSVMLAVTGMLLFLTMLLPFYIKPLLALTAPAFMPEPVTLLHDHVEDGVLYLEFSGDDILYDRAYMETTDDRRESVLFYDEGSGMIAFPYHTDTESNVYIPLGSGEKLQFLITPEQ